MRIADVDCLFGLDFIKNLIDFLNDHVFTYPSLETCAQGLVQVIILERDDICPAHFLHHDVRDRIKYLRLSK